MALDAARAITRSETRESWALWFAVLASPAAWATHLVVSYSLEEWFACSPSASGHRGEILGLSVDTVALAVNAAMAVVAAAALLTAVACSRRLAKQVDDGDARFSRARWMSHAAIIEGFLLLGAILLGLVPPFMLGTCEYAP